MVNGSPPSGTTYTGKATDFYAELPNVTGMFYANRYDLLHAVRQQEPVQPGVLAGHRASSVANQVTGGIISPVKNTVDPGGWRGRLLQRRRHVRGQRVPLVRHQADGKLHKAAWNGTTVTGPSSIDASATGNWAGKAVFVSPVAPPVAPVASFTVSCPNATCFFDASASTAPGSTITSYAWDFGDGSTGTGVKPQHTYTAVGTLPGHADRDERPGLTNDVVPHGHRHDADQHGHRVRRAGQRHRKR